MSEIESNPPAENTPQVMPAGNHKWEWWAIFAMILLAVFLVAWILVFLRLGTPSVWAHGIVVPGIGFLTVPMMFFGLLRTIFRPPAIQRPRTIALGALLFMGVFGTIPFFSPPLSTEDWSTTTEIRLPFEGEWMTMAGGEDRDRNYHATTPAYRWGYDFTVLRDGKKFQLDGAKNEDYFCFGQPVLAPLDATVYDVQNSETDNVPGEVPTGGTFGNFVILKFDENAHLFLAHLKEGSVTVAPGDTVKTGQKLGECGNSGRSLEPHLHVHAQNSAEFPFAESLPLKFSNYKIGEKLVEKGMPQGSTSYDEPNGDLVSQ